MPELDPLLEWLSGRLPKGGGVAAQPVAETDASDPSCLLGEESLLVARAARGRRAEFAAGRAAARSALAMMGLPATPILAHAARDPIWPFDVVGSISHTRHWALAAVAPRRGLAALGLDIEPDDPLDREILDFVCRPEEMAEDPGLQRRGVDTHKMRFVAKEAFYKAVFPRSRKYIGFDEVCVTFDSARDRFSASFLGTGEGAAAPIPRRAEGSFAHIAGLLCAVCALDAPGAG